MMKEADEKGFIYLISSSLTWEMNKKMRDMNSYADDIQPDMLKKSVNIETLEGSRDFPCDDCGMKFLDNKQLKVHKKVHSGDDPAWTQDAKTVPQPFILGK